MFYHTPATVDSESDAFASCYNSAMDREIVVRDIDDDLGRIGAEACARG